jgi:hypothetical protein
VAEPTPLNTLKPGRVPPELEVSYYFDFESHPFRHAELFLSFEVVTVVDVVKRIEGYAAAWLDSEAAKTDDYQPLSPPPGCLTHGKVRILCEGDVLFIPRLIVGSESGEAGTLILGRNAHIIGASIYLDRGNVYVGRGTSIDCDCVITGPTILGADNEIRPGCYLRGRIITGDGCTLRCEAKNAVFMDRAEFPHPSYVGDSLMGYQTHFANQATTSNVHLISPLSPEAKYRSVVLELDGVSYDTGMRKLGMVMGDYSQVGCSCVSDPGTFLAPRTLVYSLTRIKRGFYGPKQIIKNKPWEKGIIEVADLREEKQQGSELR